MVIRICKLHVHMTARSELIAAYGVDRIRKRGSYDLTCLYIERRRPFGSKRISLVDIAFHVGSHFLYRLAVTRHDSIAKSNGIVPGDLNKVIPAGARTERSGKERTYKNGRRTFIQVAFRHRYLHAHAENMPSISSHAKTFIVSFFFILYTPIMIT